MVRISVVIPVYNEIKFIQKTLESVIGDADEIILSDNASTDGTSDICQSFANKYPEIKYTRHKENIGSLKNHLFAYNQASGKYIRNMGAHDMISIGSNQSMASLLDKHSDVVMVYPKYIIALNEDYSFKYFYSYEKYENELLSNSAFIRAKNHLIYYKEGSILFGLWRAQIFRDIACTRIFQQYMDSDVAMLFYTAVKGKMLADERSIFFRMWNRDNESHHDAKKRYVSMLLQTKHADANPFFWYFSIIASIYDFTLEKFNENSEFYKEILHILISEYGYFASDSELTLENMPSIIPEKWEFCRNLMNTIKEYHENQKKSKEIQRKSEEIQNKLSYKKMQETDKEIFLFGAGKNSHLIIKKFPEISWKAFIENDESKVGWPDFLPIISFSDFMKDSKNALVCIASIYGKEMKQQLIDNGFPEDFIVECIVVP